MWLRSLNKPLNIGYSILTARTELVPENTILKFFFADEHTYQDIAS
jgi:hypothetical protein